MVKRTLLVALLFALLVILAPTFVEADPVISAPFVTVGVGDTFTIPVSITGATDLTSWQFDLAFNPAIVTANSVTEVGEQPVAILHHHLTLEPDVWSFEAVGAAGLFVRPPDKALPRKRSHAHAGDAHASDRRP